MSSAITIRCPRPECPSLIWSLIWSLVGALLYNPGRVLRTRSLAPAVIVLLTLLTASCGSSSSSDPVPTPLPPVQNPDQSDNNTPDTSDNQRSFSVNMEFQATLIEGSNGISLTVNIDRVGGHTDDVQLELLGAGATDAENLVAFFEQAVLRENTENTRLNLELNVAMAPILRHTRSLLVRAADGTRTVDTALSLTVEPIDAPDLYLLIGQSNMQGSSEYSAKDIGQNGQDRPNPRIRQLNVTGNNFDHFTNASDFSNPNRNVASPRFVIAEDPLHETTDSANANKPGTQIGIGLSFAKAALPFTTRDIILIPAAWSGTAFCDNNLDYLAWNAEPTDHSALGGTGLFDRAVVRANLAIEETGGILRGILWHQGESDATTHACANLYQDNLMLMISMLRNNIRPDQRGSIARGVDGQVPFILGTMSRGNDPRGSYFEFDSPKTTVDSVHRSITMGSTPKVRHGAYVDNDDLAPSAWPCGQGSCVHFGSSALREMGRRYYQKLREILANQ